MSFIQKNHGEIVKQINAFGMRGYDKTENDVKMFDQFLFTDQVGTLVVAANNAYIYLNTHKFHPNMRIFWDLDLIV